MNEEFVRRRITQLRIQKNISEYKMSYDLGHSKGYIQGISSGRALPSMSEFLYICEYLGVTPKQFFDEETENPEIIERILSSLKKLDNADLERIADLADRLSK